MDSGDDESTGDSAEMMGKDSQKMQENLWKAGYRDGKDEGRKEGLQEGFDKGYELAFEHSMKMGQLRGMIDAMILKDSTLTKFLNPLVERLDKEAKDLQSFDMPADKTPEETMTILREKWANNLHELVELFIRIFPYGENEAVKILETATTFYGQEN